MKPVNPLYRNLNVVGLSIDTLFVVQRHLIGEAHKDHLVALELLQSEINTFVKNCMTKLNTQYKELSDE